MHEIHPPATITDVPKATASAPRHRAFTASTPSRSPPIRTNWILSRASISSSASIASIIAGNVGIPTLSITSALPAPVEPCMPSSSTKSNPSLEAILMSSRILPAPNFTLTGTSYPVASRNSSTLMTRSSAPRISGWRDGERKSMPDGMPRISASSGVTFLAINCPPRPGFAPWEM